MGLIFSEGTLISPQGTEWPHVAGIYDDAHAKAWKKVVDSVHAEGTSIVAQLWHVGRVAHPDMEAQKKAGSPVYGPSAVSARGGKVSQVFIRNWIELTRAYSSVNSLESQDTSPQQPVQTSTAFWTSTRTLPRWPKLLDSTELNFIQQTAISSSNFCQISLMFGMTTMVARSRIDVDLVWRLLSD